VLRFFQLYIYRERQITVQLVQRAERAGFSALMLTVDTPFFGKRRDDNRNKFRLPPHLRYARWVV
jgi:(S)-2-hydroxy-acid oxidase